MIEKISKILGSIITFIAYTISHLLYNSKFGMFEDMSIKELEVRNELIGLIYALSLSLGLAILFYGIGLGEKVKKVKHLIYYNLSFFFIVMFLIYSTDVLTLIDDFIRTFKVYIAFTISTFLCVLIYLFSQRRY